MLMAAAAAIAGQNAPFWAETDVVTRSAGL
jgi:hypothetical protein